MSAPYSHGEANNEIGQTAGDAATDYWGDRRGYVADSLDFAWLPHPPELTITFPEDMSNNGYFAGQGTTAPSGQPGFAYRGVVWTPGGDTYVISPPRRVRDAVMRDVNDAGRAVGFTSRQTGGTVPLPAPLVWQHGVARNLNDLIPGLPPLLGAIAINNQGQIYAGSSEVGQFILTPVWLPGDLTGDCHVSVEDLILVLSNFGMPQGSFPRGDVDLDGAVDLCDLTILLAHWGE